jgi:hypothetical protein
MPVQGYRHGTRLANEVGGVRGVVEAVVYLAEL